MTTEWTFDVPAPVMGAVRTTQRQMWVDPRYKAYNAFKKRVRLLANVAGVPSELESSTVKLIGPRYSITVHVHWKARARVDLDNVVKGLLDALWSQDRRVLSIHADATEKNGVEERMTVSVSRMET